MLAVVIPTLGRPNVILSMIKRLQEQSRKPDHVVISVVSKTDIPPDFDVSAAGCSVTLLTGPAGSSRQRNLAVNWLFAEARFGTSSDVAVFFDDDFVPRADWLAEAEVAFEADAQLVGLTGIVLADGAGLVGYTESEANSIIAAGQPVLPARDWRLQPGATKGLYGCNMAVRGNFLASVRFDEALPLYAWLEDYDFSTELRRYGVLSRSSSLLGVHLGTKESRGSGRRLGYSQIANAVYLSRKGTLSRKQAAILIVKNILANLAKSPRPEPFIDRRGRALGNINAGLDLLRGRLHPSRIVR